MLNVWTWSITYTYSCMYNLYIGAEIQKNETVFTRSILNVWTWNITDTYNCMYNLFIWSLNIRNNWGYIYWNEDAEQEHTGDPEAGKLFRHLKFDAPLRQSELTKLGSVQLLMKLSNHNFATSTIKIFRVSAMLFFSMQLSNFMKSVEMKSHCHFPSFN